MDPRRYFRPDFDELEAYAPVKPLDVLAAEIGVPVGDLVKLDANENLYGPHPAVAAAARAAELNIYPDPGQLGLRQAIAEYAGVSAEQVVAGSGADDLIDMLFRLLMPAIAVTASPTFGMYSFLAQVNRTRFVDVPRRDGFALDVPALASTVERGAKLVFLTSPNNPTGNSLTASELEAVSKLDAVVVIDEAYVEFGGQSAVPFIANHPNIVVLRTFSKWAGLAGLRVGYSISHPAIAAGLMAIKQPYNVNVPGDFAARAALQHRDEIFATVRAIAEERNRMAQAVGSLGWLKPLPSDSNFVLFEVDASHSASKITAELRRRGVLIRYYQRPDLANYIRISAARKEDTDRLIAALRDVEPATRETA